MSESAPKDQSPQAESKKSKSSWVWILLLLILLAVGGYFYLNRHDFPFLSRWNGQCDTDQKAIQAQGAQLATQGIQLQMLVEKIEVLTQTLHALKQEQADLKSSLKELEVRKQQSVTEEDKMPVSLSPSTSLQAQLEKERRYRRTFKSATVLKRLVSQGQPYTIRYKELWDLLSDEGRKFLLRLDPYQEAGIPTLSNLIEEFGRLASEIDRSQLPQGGWKEKVMYRVKNLVTVYKKGESKDLLNEEVASIREALKSQQFQQALEKSHQMKYSSPLKSQWENHMRTYLQAKQALDALFEHISNMNEVEGS